VNPVAVADMVDNWMVARSRFVWMLHVADPGPTGEFGQCIDGRTVEVTVMPLAPGRWRVTTPALWRELRGVPGMMTTITHLSLWADNWLVEVIPLRTPFRVPHLGSLEIPAGTTLTVATSQEDYA
jgi:hypothetical protein